MSQTASVLEGTKGERVALCDVSVTATLHDILAEVVVKQAYRNDEKVNIEAVYTFPLPIDATLLKVTVTINGRTLTGVVVEKKAAEERYENALAAGDAAVMLEEAEPGLYTMNVGNLAPNETAVIAVTYAVMYRWTGDNLRMMIPTTIAPRYGESPLQPHQTPEHSLMVENQFSLEVEVFGALRDARFECPSHEVTLTASPDKTTIALSSAKAAMDRDFVLNVKAPEAVHGFAVCGADGAGDDGAENRIGTAVVAAIKPVFPGLRKPRKLNLVVVIDCSGSMQGDSITQARQAVLRILDELQRDDLVTIIAFGNSTKMVFDELRPCTDENLHLARKFATDLQADMGGTEIGGALRAAYAATSDSEAADIFLVTDGEVSDWERVVKDAKKSNRRIFTVGVGSAVSEAFVRQLATVTAGECELVSPREGMADRVVRHFERMRAPRAKRVVVHWPEGARNQAPATIGTVFEGDTVFVSAQFDRPSVTGHVVMEIETESGQVFRQELVIGQAPALQSGSSVSTVARIAAAMRIKELDGAAAARMAVQYQLASPWTNWLVVVERPEGEKAFEIPAIRKVPQTLAAGWGGVGSLMAQLRAPSASHVMRRLDMNDTGSFERAMPIQAWESSAGPDDEALLDRLAFEFVSEVDDLAEQTDMLAGEFGAVAGDARDQIRHLQNQIAEFIARVMSAFKSIERRAEEMERALEALAARAPGFERADIVLSTRTRLTELRDRLRRLRKLLVHLERNMELLREAEGVLQRA